MLNKRFKIAKCKTSLKLATSRIKLMRNKKGVQINQMKTELAQLLESGQDRTARIRVEHVIREEKLVAAYDLIEIYCELIVARLPIIESQKTCPIDLKEAVTSVIFAAPRCSDIPELADAKKNFTAKYGKEFVSAAIELRPDCGVSRMLVEKLSAVAPDLETKIKVLSAVAKERNINWDPTAFEEKESKPPDDLLNGPTYFEKASTISVNPPEVQTSNVQNVHTHEGNQNGHFDFTQQNRRFTVDAQNVTTADTGGVQKSSASTTHDDMRPSGLGSGMMNTSQSFHSNHSNSFGRENWNMEFKDATSAAQAAAESAERASIAARAAAQLSSQGKITRQYSSASYISEPNPQASSAYTGQHDFKDSYSNTSFNDRKPKIQNQQMGPTEIDSFSKATKKSSSLRSRYDSVKESSADHFETHENSLKKESGARFTHGDNEGPFKSPNVGYYGGVVKEQPSITPLRTHSTTIGNERDDLASYQQKADKRSGVDQEKLSRETTKYDGAHSDDGSDSDDGPRFDTAFEYDEGEAKSFFPSPDRESFYPQEETHTSISSPKKNTSNTMDRVDSTKSVDQSVKFDHSGGPDSEIENETKVMNLSFGRAKKTTSRVDASYVESPPKVNPRKSRIELNDLVENETKVMNSSFGRTKKTTSRVDPSYVESPPVVSPRKSRIELNDLVENETKVMNLSFGRAKKSTSRVDPTYVESPPKVSPAKSRIELNDLVENETKVMNSSSGRTKTSTSRVDPTYVESPPKASPTKSQFELNDLVKTGSSFQKEPDDVDTGTNLNFGALTGGLRHKGGLKYPPYTKTADKESPEKTDPTSNKQSSFSSRTSRLDNKKPSVSGSSFESDADDHNETFLVQKSFKTKSQFAPPDRFFSYDEPDSEEEVPVSKQMSTGKVHLDPGLSRRTKGQVEPTGKAVISTPNPIRELLETSSTSAEQKLNTRPSITKSPPEPRPDPACFKQEPFRTKPGSKASEPPANPTKKIVESGKTEAPKAMSVSSETKPEANNAKKPSHVHPKLPDYDSLAARIQALSKMNNQ